jgi:hypothetical protein
MLKREAPRTRTAYVYRRQLDAHQLLPAIGVGVGVGALAFYVAYLFLQRTPLEPKDTLPAEPKRRLLRGATD